MGYRVSVFMRKNIIAYGEGAENYTRNIIQRVPPCLARGAKRRWVNVSKELCLAPRCASRAVPDSAVVVAAISSELGKIVTLDEGHIVIQLIHIGRAIGRAGDGIRAARWRTLGATEDKEVVIGR